MVIETLIRGRDDRLTLKLCPQTLLVLSCFASGFLVAACAPHTNFAETLSSQQQALDCPHDLTGELQWNTFMGLTGTHYGNNAKAAPQGDVYACGMSNQTWGNPVRAFGDGNWDAFIARLNPTTGAFVWNTFLGQTSAAGDYCDGIDVDPTGVVYVAGHSSETWDTPLHAFNLGNDTFIARLNTNGTLQWHTFWGGTGDDQNYDIVLSGGRVVVIGTSTRNWGTPVRPYSGGGLDALVMALDTDGNLLWTAFLGGMGVDVGYAIAAASDGSIYCVGNSSRTWGNPIRPFSGNSATDGYVAKLDSNGNLVWNTFLGSTSADESRDIQIDSTSNLWVVGFSDGTWLTPIRAHSGDGNSDGFVAKLSTDGNILWTTFLGGPGVDITDGVTPLSDGAYTSGWSQQAWGTPWRAFQGGLSDAFVAKLDTAGNLLTNGFLGSDGGFDTFDDDYGNAISSTGDGKIYVVGDSDAPWGNSTNTFAKGNHASFIASFFDPPACDAGVDGGFDGGFDGGVDGGPASDGGPNQNLPTLNYRVSCGCSSESGANPLFGALVALILMWMRRLNAVFSALEQPRNVPAMRKEHQQEHRN